MVDYNISAVRRRKVFSGSAGVGPYACTFEIIAQTDIAVYKNTTLLTLTTDYTVSINSNGTFSVTLVVAATGSDTVTVTGARAIERTTDFVTAGDLRASALNDQLDSLTISAQQLAEEGERSIRFPITDSTTLSAALPVAATRASKVLAFDSSGNVTVSTETITSIEGSITTSAASAAAAASSASAAATSASTATTQAAAAAASATAAAASASGMKWRPSVRVATTANITLSGAQTIDGVSVIAGDRVLVKNQSTSANNGVYVCAAGAWSRDTDADAWAELVAAAVIVEEGTTNADTVWICTVNSGGTLGVTSVTWASLTFSISDGSVTPAKLAGGTLPAATGYSATDYNAGTKSSGTYTPDPANGNFQYAVNGGAHTLAPPAASGTLIVQYTNNGSAGSITTSGFTKVSGSFTTTNGDDFLCYITRLNSFTHLNIVALQ